MSLPKRQAFLQGAGPVLEAYERGGHPQAFAMFMSVVSGLEWPACRALLEERAPGVVAQSIADDTFFGIELPSLAQWKLDAPRANTIARPSCPCWGTETLPVWVEVAAFLRANVPNVEDCRIDGVGHLLHVQRPDPVAKGMRAFLGRHAMASS